MFGFCVKADPDDVLAALLELLFRSVLDAAEDAGEDVTFEGAFLCDSAEPAADFADLLEVLLRNTLEAAVAARLLVTSVFLAMSLCLLFVRKLIYNLNR